jgi:prevent-host-death family protein
MNQISLEDAGNGLGQRLDDALASPEPVVLVRRGEPVAAIVPFAEYEAFRAWREAEGRRARRAANEAAFARERATYAEMEEKLRDQYAGMFVAIHGGQVVDSDADELALLRRVSAKLGPVPVYVRQVGAPLPVVRLRSPRLICP